MSLLDGVDLDPTPTPPHQPTPDLLDRPEQDAVNLMVVVRIRNLSEDEVAKGASQVAYQVSDNMVVLMDPGDDLDDVLRLRRSREKKFLFDRVFGPDSAQEEVYEVTTKQLISTVLNGYNSTVFAYGATGAGKTYTMLGTPEKPGIMWRALDDLFKIMERTSETKQYDVNLSYLEIYNEMIRDLLNPASGILELREDVRGNIQVTGLSQSTASSSQEVTVVQKERLRSVKDQQKVGSLFLIDLAGSERASNTQNTGIRMKEGAAINRSLLALGNVINTLTEKGARFVNYRDSKLTRLLKDSLGGNSRTVMIATISPASVHFEESRNTLIYADRAKSIRTRLMQNNSDVDYHVVQYQAIISELRKEINRLQTKIEEQNGGRPDSSVSYINEKNNQRSQNQLPPLRQASDENRQAFLKLKDDLIARFNVQMKIRHKLLELNDKAYGISVDLAKKEAELQDLMPSTKSPRKQADDNANQTSNDGTDSGMASSSESDVLPLPDPKQIGSIRSEISNLESQLDFCMQRRQELEWELMQSRTESEKLEEALPKKITSEDLNSVLDLLTRLHEAEVDKVLLESDSLLSSRRLQNQKHSAKSCEQLSNTIDRLINEQQALIESNQISGNPYLANLYNDYKTMKFAHRITLATSLSDNALRIGERSWNRDIVEKERRQKDSKVFSRTMNYAELQRRKVDLELGRERRGSYNGPSLSRLERLPSIGRDYSKDDSVVSYEPQPESDLSPAVPFSTVVKSSRSPLSELHRSLDLASPSAPKKPLKSIIKQRTKVRRNSDPETRLSRQSTVAINVRMANTPSPTLGERPKIRNKNPKAKLRRSVSQSHSPISLSRHSFQRRATLQKRVTLAQQPATVTVSRKPNAASNNLKQQQRGTQKLSNEPGHVTGTVRPLGASRIPALQTKNPNRRVRSPTVPKLPYIHRDHTNTNVVARKAKT